MENNIKKQLMKVKSNAILAKAAYSYISSLSDIFISDLSLFNNCCEEFGLTDEELLEIMTNYSPPNISVLDELYQFVLTCKYKHNEEEGKRL